MQIGIAGAGGIGSNVAFQLVRSGVRHLRIVDFDAIESTNLNRQFYFADQVGQPKAATLAQKPPLALRLIKEGLEKSFDMSLKEALDWEAAHQAIALQTPEHKEIVKLFLDAKKMK